MKDLGSAYVICQEWLDYRTRHNLYLYLYSISISISGHGSRSALQISTSHQNHVVRTRIKPGILLEGLEGRKRLGQSKNLASPASASFIINSRTCNNKHSCTPSSNGQHAEMRELGTSTVPITYGTQLTRSTTSLRRVNLHISTKDLESPHSRTSIRGRSDPSGVRQELIPFFWDFFSPKHAPGPPLWT